MLFTSSRGRKLARHAAVMAAVGVMSSGIAYAQGQPATSRPKAAASKPSQARPAEQKPAEEAPAAATEPSESAMKPEDILRSPTDPVVGIVEGQSITLSDVGREVPKLPESLRGLPFDTLLPIVLDRIIDHRALVAAARRRQLDEDPGVRQEIDAATDRALESALIAHVAVPQASEEAIRARYAKLYAGKPVTEETRARHILVSTEAKARTLIAELNKGADFPTLAKDYSTDPDRDTGGDLGFFRRDQVWPEFADVAFALQPGQFSQTPIHNEFGWHIVKVEERRIVAPPTYSEAHDAIRDKLLQEAVQQTISDARAALTIHKYKLDGSPLEAMPDITPARPLLKPEDTPSGQ